MKRCRILSITLALALLLSTVFVCNAAVADTKDSEPDLTIAMKNGVYASDDTLFINLVHQYEKETGKKVEVTFYPRDEEVNTKMNIELLAGAGQDLIQGTDLPFWALAQRGVFANYSELIANDPDVDISDFYGNIINPLKDSDGNLYIMPCSFSFDIIMPNTALLEKVGLSVPEDWTLQSLIDSCVAYTALKEKPSDTYAMSWWGKDYFSEISADELITAVDFNKEIADFTNLDTGVIDYLMTLPKVSNGTLFNPYDISSYAYFMMDIGLSPLMRGDTLTLFENDQYEARNLPRSTYKKGEYLFTPQLAFCINNAGRTEEAWLFMKFMLSNNVQTGNLNVDYAITNPVNKAAAEARITLIRNQVSELVEKLKNGQQIETRYTRSKHSPEDYVNQISRYVSVYTDLRDALTTPIISDNVLKDSLLSSVEQMRAENYNAAKVRNELTRIVDVYMSETGGDIRSGYTVIYIALAVVAVGGATAGILVVVRIHKRAKAQ